jgi:hypothetical protein
MTQTATRKALDSETMHDTNAQFQREHLHGSTFQPYTCVVCKAALSIDTVKFSFRGRTVIAHCGSHQGSS